MQRSTKIKPSTHYTTRITQVTIYSEKTLLRKSKIEELKKFTTDANKFSAMNFKSAQQTYANTS